MDYSSRISRRSFAVIASIALVAACRDKAPVANADSSLTKDLQLAQQVAPPQTVFNDAPVGAAAPTSNAASAPNPGPQQARQDAPTPRPSHRRDAPPAPVARSPQPTPPQQVATAPAAMPAAAPAAGVIGSGSRVGMSTDTKVCAASLLVGDKLSATVSSGTVGTNGASIPAGATVVLEVASISKADPIEQSQIQFRVRAIDVNGQPVPATGDVSTPGSLQRVQTGGNNDKTKVIGGAVAGAVLGRIFGGSTKATVIGGAVGAGAGAVAANAGHSTDACLPAGSALSLTLTRDIVVARTGGI